MYREAAFDPSEFTSQTALVAGQDFGTRPFIEGVFNYNRAFTASENNVSSIYSTGSVAQIKVLTTSTKEFQGAILIGSCYIDQAKQSCEDDHFPKKVTVEVLKPDSSTSVYVKDTLDNTYWPYLPVRMA